MIRSETEAVDRKQRIRDRYKGVDTSELEVIPAKAVEGLGESTSIRRVAAYVRVSTDNDEQTSSYELQKNYYTEYIKAQPGWEFVGIYDDEGISGTQTAKRAGFNRMIHDATLGAIDLILTKEVSRFARNTVDTLSYTRKLKESGIGVIFTNDNIDTREPDGELRLTIMASIAQEESRKTAERVKWGQKRKMEQGVVFGRDLVGYKVNNGILISPLKRGDFFFI